MTDKKFEQYRNFILHGWSELDLIRQIDQAMEELESDIVPSLGTINGGWITDEIYLPEIRKARVRMREILLSRRAECVENIEEMFNQIKTGDYE